VIGIERSAPLKRRRPRRGAGPRDQAGSRGVSAVTRSARNRARHWGARAARGRRGGCTRGRERDSGAWWRLEKSSCVVPFGVSVATRGTFPLGAGRSEGGGWRLTVRPAPAGVGTAAPLTDGGSRGPGAG
jgi:hypothetical protein